MNNFIENISREDIKTALHTAAGVNSMLIQISDIGYNHPVPLKPFKEIFSFNFDDIEEDVDRAISQTQAEEIAALLRYAKLQNMNVIVHCHAGLCRSGAVVECGIFLGFNDTGHLRWPNALVKKKIMMALSVDDAPISAFAEDFYNREFD